MPHTYSNGSLAEALQHLQEVASKGTWGYEIDQDLEHGQGHVQLTLDGYGTFTAPLFDGANSDNDVVLIANTLNNLPNLIKAVHLLEDVQNSYMDDGCDGCGTIDAEVYQKVCDFLDPPEDE